jgi:branched-chain amino acid transport system substrate-binding protein
MRMTFRTLGSAIVAALLLLSGSAHAPAIAADPVEVNVVISMTGQGAFLGSELKESMQLAADVANKGGGIGGRPLKVNFFDDQTNPQVAVQLFNQLSAKHVPVVVGPSFTAPCLAAAATVQANGPVLLCSSPAMHPTHGSYAFSMTPGIIDDLAVYVRFFRLHGWNRIGLITSADATGQDVERQLGAVLSAPENKNMKVVESDRFELGALDTTAQFSRLKAANCDAIIAWTTGAPWGTLVHGIDNVGLNVPIVTSPGNMVNAQMESLANILPKQLYFAGLNGMVRNALRPGPVADAQKVYYAAIDGAKVRQDFGNLTSWDTMMIVIDALRHLGPDATAAQMRSYILGLHGWPGVEGVYDFSDAEQRGVGQNALFIAAWDPAKKGWTAQSRPGGYLK